jgi:hypothetical protein
MRCAVGKVIRQFSTCDIIAIGRVCQKTIVNDRGGRMPGDGKLGSHVFSELLLRKRLLGVS